MSRIAIDPVTRVGGHLRIEAELTDGSVGDAWSSGTMFRGMEAVLLGRDPRDAWLLAQRICGTCTGIHALASVRAVEQALGIGIPTNARLLRNLLAGSTFVLDHVIHFYHRQVPDWVDPASALRADPTAAARWARDAGTRPAPTAESLKAVQDRLVALARSGAASPLVGSDVASSAGTKVSPEGALVLVAHELDAFDWQRLVVRFQTMLGGKSPHPQTFLVGGMAIAPAWGGPTTGAPGEHPLQIDRDHPPALSSAGLAQMVDLLADIRAFVEQVYAPDVLALARAYPEWSKLGAGLGHYLSYGEFPEDDASAPALLFPRGRIMDRDLSATRSVDQAGITENVAHAWYAGDGEAYVRPSDGRTEPAYSGPTPPVTTLAGSDRYSWIKAPRYSEDPMEVGPLARLLVAYVEGRGSVRDRLDEVVGRLGLGPEALFSTMGRIVARSTEAQVIAERLGAWLQELEGNLAKGDLAVADLSRWDPATWPAEIRGWSLGEGPGGAVGHWLRIAGGRVADYQVVDATGWNASPRDARGLRGALEAALVGTPVADPAHPVEILRTVHSFDPCPACAVHAYDPTGDDPVTIHVAEEGAR